MRVRELIEPLGFDGGKSIVDDYLREVRPLFLPPRTFQRTVYRPGEICQWDLWEPSRRCRSVTGSRAGRGSWSLHGVLPRGRRRADLQQGSTGRVVGHEPLPCGRSARCRGAGLGPRGVPARRRRPPDRCLCGVLWAAEGRLVFLRAGRPAGEGCASSGCRSIWRATSSRAGSSRTTSTSSCSSTPGSRRPTPRAPDVPRPARRPARRGARGDASAARKRSPISTGAG